MPTSGWENVTPADEVSAVVMVDQFYDLCDSALLAAQRGSLRAHKLMDAARRLAVWLPLWLALDLEVDAYLDRLQLAVDTMLTAGTDRPAA
jgi:hypothetical protein